MKGHQLTNKGSILLSLSRKDSGNKGSGENQIPSQLKLSDQRFVLKPRVCSA